VYIFDSPARPGFCHQHQGREYHQGNAWRLTREHLLATHWTNRWCNTWQGRGTVWDGHGISHQGDWK